jgi:hypothetical protein
MSIEETKIKTHRRWKGGLDKIQKFFDKASEANALFCYGTDDDDYYALFGRLEALSEVLISARIALGNLTKTL